MDFESIYQPGQSFDEKMKRAFPFIIIVLVLGACVLMFMYFRRSTAETTSATPASASPTLEEGSTAKQPPEPGAEPPHAQGNPNATVTLEEFGDFQCPPCGAVHPILKNLEKEFGPAKLRIIFREFPLVPTHEHALAAARAAEAAGLQGKFWEMHDMIYEHQK